MTSFAGDAQTLPLRLFVLLLLASSSSVLSFQPEENGVQSRRNKEIPNGFDAGESTGPVNYWSQRRILLQVASNNTGAETSGRPLAVKDGRLDPFNHLRKYRGGYDLESKHYWGSVVFTGIFGYALAAALLLSGLILGLYHCRMRYCGERKARGAFIVDQPRVPHFRLVVFCVVLLTIGALAGCVALYVGNRNFTVEARDVERTLNRAADNATVTIGNVTAAMTEVVQLFKPYESSESILEFVNTKERLANESDSVQNTVDKNTRILDKIVTATEAALILVTTLNLVGVIMGPVFAVWNRRGIFNFIVVACWILAVLNSFLFGLYFAFNNVVEDTCDAMVEYTDQPYNTTLDALLPCEDLLSARGIVVDIAKRIRGSLISVNDTLISVQQLLNNSMRPLCERIGPPPEYEYIGSCPNNTITIGDLPQELEPLRCSSNDSASCIQQSKFLTDSDYQKVMAYASSAELLLNTYPTMDRLTDCSLIVYAFAELTENNCSPANSAVRLIWISFVVVALTMVFVILSWRLLYLRGKNRKSMRIVAPQEEIFIRADQTK